MLKILVLGDVVVRPGRTLLLQRLPEIRSELGIDLVVANGENAAAGAGITGKIAHQLCDGGVDGITLGDHTWDQKIFLGEIDELTSVCRPANFPKGVPGRDRLILDHGGVRIGVFTVLGRNFMGPKVDCPFKTSMEYAQIQW